MDKIIRIGVMGARRGSTFMVLSRCMPDKAKLVSVCETESEPIQDRLNDGHMDESVKVYSDYDEFLDSGIDAVVLCNYFHEHAEYAIRALKKGIHVLSDTTPASTLGYCVKLCEAVEESGAKYMLGTNAAYKRLSQFMKREIKAGKIGTPIYGDAEYFHWSPIVAPYADDNRHWRRLMPGTFYNMHTLGTLMYITETVPTKVCATTVGGKDSAARNRLIDHDGAKVLCEMDNGAKFDVTGCTYMGPTSKWFRLVGDKGVLESKRYDESRVLFVDSTTEFLPDSDTPVVGKPIEEYAPKYSELGIVSDEEFATITEEQMNVGHNGMDYFLFNDFLKYIKGEHEPFFNVYRSAALSAAAILGWRSVVNGSIEYDIPDFTDKEARKAVANDFSSPFVDEDSEYFIRRTKKA